MRRDRDLDQEQTVPMNVGGAPELIRPRPLFPLILCWALACARQETPATTTAGTPDWLLARQRATVASASGWAVAHDFGFSDRVTESGISFETRIVEDAGKFYKHVHYDHGTGLAVADVDGDSLPDLYFITQLGSNELWKNLGGGKFANFTDSAGLRMPDAVGVTASFADTDNDGDADLFVTTVRHGNHFFENRGGGRFRDATAEAGLEYVGHSSGAVFFDYDSDGRLDLFLTNVGVYTTDSLGPGGYHIGMTDAFHGHIHPERAEASILYRNLGQNRFQNVSRETGLLDESWSGDAGIIDANDDGRPDLYVLNMLGANHLWLNSGGKRFVDATARYFPRTPWGAMGMKVFDYDGDGRFDLFVTDMHSDMWDNIGPEDVAAENRKADTNSRQITPVDFPTGKQGFVFGNALFANRGSRFEEVSDSVGVETYWPWGPSVDDVNADGWDDILVTSSMNFPFRYQPNALLLNEQGKRFLHGEFVLGIEPRPNGAFEKLWFVLECEGADQANRICQVCYRKGATEPECQHKEPGGRLTMMGALGTRSAAIFDLDRDGDLDIVTNEFFGKPQVLVSDLAQRRAVHALSVGLRGTRSNRQGIGARVTVVLADGRRILKLMDGKSGYLSQSVLPLYFGLGDADHASRIEVVWPSGRRQTLPGPLAAGRAVEIVEP
jgi:hypothetical protein